METIRVYKPIPGKRPVSIGVILIPDPSYVFISCTECRYRTNCDHRGCKARKELGEPLVQPYIKTRYWEYPKSDILSKMTLKTESELSEFVKTHLATLGPKYIENEEDI